MGTKRLNGTFYALMNGDMVISPNVEGGTMPFYLVRDQMTTKYECYSYGFVWDKRELDALIEDGDLQEIKNRLMGPLNPLA